MDVDRRYDLRPRGRCGYYENSIRQRDGPESFNDGYTNCFEIELYHLKRSERYANFAYVEIYVYSLRPCRSGSKVSRVSIK